MYNFKNLFLSFHFLLNQKVEQTCAALAVKSSQTSPQPLSKGEGGFEIS
jgi:hypothetical protein